MSFRNERQLDDTDWRILEELQADGRLSYNELGRRSAFLLRRSPSAYGGSKNRASSPATKRASTPLGRVCP